MVAHSAGVSDNARNEDNPTAAMIETENCR
jgi:hypothetical protein